MSLNALHFVKRGLTHMCVAREPSVWGKLPTHGDYIRHNVSHEQTEFWLQWTSDYWHRRPSSPNIPVAFIFPPRTTPFAGDCFVQGVIAASEDKVGRSCPLVIFQEVTHREMSRLWPLQIDMSIEKHGRHMLYWWARIAAHAKASADFHKLIELVDLIWQSYEPSFLEVLGISAPSYDVKNFEYLLNEFDPLKVDDATKLKGVRRLPWTDWPSRFLRQSSPIPAYWMQDSYGGYVCASEGILKLWGVRA